MLIFIRKFFYVFYFILNVLSFYIKGLLITKNMMYCYILRFNLIFIINFFKYNVILGLSSLLDIIVIDNVNLNYNRFEIAYIFWNIYYSCRLCIKLYTTQLNGIMSISSYFSNAID
jgi:hypothetical protein